jgi:hypothetical protein
VPELHVGVRVSSRAPHVFRASAGDWCARASEISVAAGEALAWRAAYRLGDAVLEVASDCDALIGELSDHYGECEIAPTDLQGQALPRVRAVVRARDGARLALIRYESMPSIPAFDLALGLLKHPAADPRYIEGAPQADGWRLIVQSTTAAAVVAARGQDLLVDLSHAGARLLGQLLVDPVLALQRGLLFAHAASVGIAGAGVLLVGPSGSGKTTTAVSLASRGHRYFGDDVAALRIESAELLPFWRIAHVRPGPHAQSLGHHLATGAWDAPYSDGLPRLRLRVADVFPSAASAPLPLRRALFLRSFAAQPRIERFIPTVSEFGRGSRFALNNTLWVAWGTTPPLRLMQFMLFQRLLERVPCAWLDVADPEATADLIEHSLEDSWH